MTELAPLPVGAPRRLVYLGTPQMAVAPLEALVAAGFEIALVVTRADKRRGRGAELAPSPVKAAAQRLGLPVSHVAADAVGAGADLGVVVAFGQLIKPDVLAVLPMVNLHFSLLPRWRGAAPVERALLAGDETTGVCLMQLEVGLDTGGILDRIEVPIGARQTADDLRRALVDVGTTQLVDNLRRGLGDVTAQVGDATYAAKLDPAEFAIDWTRPAIEIDRLVRLGVAWTWFRGKRLKVLETEPGGSDGQSAGASASGAFVAPLSVECWRSTLTLVRVQPEGKPPMPAAAWANGARPTALDVFGVEPASAPDAP
ncbi:MAG: fmt [Ilumatobacteraceae bacterium]|nr:fmt [Ilumatobacteraceae bacterium]